MSRHALSLVGSVVFVFVAGCGKQSPQPDADPPAPADHSPQGIVRAAITAHGGADRLARTCLVRFQSKVRMGPPLFIPEQEIEREVLFAYPSPRERETMKGSLNGQPQTVVVVTFWDDLHRGWLRVNRQEPQAVYPREKLPFGRIWYENIAILRDLVSAEYALSEAGREQLDGREVIGVKISRGREEATFYFDARSHLLAIVRVEKKTEGERAGPDAPPPEVLVHDYIYRDYTTVAGVQYPTRITWHSSTRPSADTDTRVTHIEFPDSIPDDVFTKP